MSYKTNTYFNILQQTNLVTCVVIVKDEKEGVASYI